MPSKLPFRLTSFTCFVWERDCILRIIFSPNFLVALKAPKNKEQSIVELTFKRHVDFYEIKWERGRNWRGTNSYDGAKEVVKKFVINWKKHTIESLDKIQKEKEEKEIKTFIAKLNSEDVSFLWKSKPTTPEQIAIKKKIDELEAKNKITKEFEIDDSKTEVLPNGGVIIGGKYIWDIVK